MMERNRAPIVGFFTYPAENRTCLTAPGGSGSEVEIGAGRSLAEAFEDAAQQLERLAADARRRAAAFRRRDGSRPSGAGFTKEEARSAMHFGGLRRERE